MENLDKLIADRLGEHQRKVDFVSERMNQKQADGSKWSKWRVTLSVAASIAIIIALYPMLTQRGGGMDVTPPDFTEYRGGSAGFEEIEHLIAAENYDKALAVVNQKIIDMEVDHILFAPGKKADKAEAEYEEALYHSRREELMWSEIYLLVKIDEPDELSLSCRKYLEEPSYNVHREEVEKIFKKID